MRMVIHHTRALDVDAWPHPDTIGLTGIAELLVPFIRVRVEQVMTITTLARLRQGWWQIQLCCCFVAIVLAVDVDDKEAKAAHHDGIRCTVSDLVRSEEVTHVVAHEALVPPARL